MKGHSTGIYSLLTFIPDRKVLPFLGSNLMSMQLPWFSTIYRTLLACMFLPSEAGENDGSTVLPQIVMAKVLPCSCDLPSARPSRFAICCALPLKSAVSSSTSYVPAGASMRYYVRSSSHVWYIGPSTVLSTSVVVERCLPSIHPHLPCSYCWSGSHVKLLTEDVK